MVVSGSFDIVVENLHNFKTYWFSLGNLNDISWDLNITNELISEENYICAYLKCKNDNSTKWPVVASFSIEMNTLDDNFIKKVELEPYIFENNKNASGNQLITLENIPDDEVKIKCTINIDNLKESKMICNARTLYGNGLTNDVFSIQIQKFSSLMALKKNINIRENEGYFMIFKSTKNNLHCVIKFKNPMAEPTEIHCCVEHDSMLRVGV